MGIQFILGRAGSGKTTTMTTQLQERLQTNPAGRPLILIVPEQATFQAEYTLATLPGLQGVIGSQVLSFGRLAFRLLQEMGGATLLPIDDLGKQMVLRMLLERYRDQLTLFHRSAQQPGFVGKLARMVSECKAFGISTEELDEAAWGSGTLTQKLHDLRVIMGAYDAYLEGKYYDTDEMLSRVAAKAADSEYIRDAEIWIDGFTGFTAQEYLMVEQLMRHARQVTIALSLDPDERDMEADELALFHPTITTYQRISRMAREAGVSIDDPILLTEQRRFAQSPSLSHLERHLFHWRKPAASPAPARENEVMLIAAANRRAEVEAVALQILSLARDHHYRWRDMAILLRDILPYADEIESVFQEYKIPHFLDQKRTVMHHPVIELIRSALEVVTGKWRYESVVRCLKTDLIMPEQLSLYEVRSQIDLLENYVLAYGIFGSHWADKEPWGFHGQKQGYEQIDEIRRRFAQPLLALDAELQRAKEMDVRAITTALYQFLLTVQVPDQLEKWQDQAEEAGELDAAQEHGQVWNGVMQLFDQMVEAMGDERLDLETYVRILDSGLESITLGLVPPALDQVLVGQMERSRQPDVKALFILGVNEGMIPMRHVEDGILDEAERERLTAAGYELAPSAKQLLMAEQFLLYQAITRPSERLWLSASLADSEGKALLPSAIMERVKETLPGTSIRFFANEPTGDAAEDQFLLGRPSQVFGHLLTLLRQVKRGGTLSPFWWEVYEWFVRHSADVSRERWLLSGLRYANRVTPLPQQTSHALYGKNLRMSVSRLERFQTCPFSHFSSHGLRLTEREMYRLERFDVGELFHESLKRVVEKMKLERLEWAGISEEGSMRLAGEVVDEVVPITRSNILQRTARYRYLTGRLKRAVGRAIYVLGEHAKRSKFVPIGLEVSFGPNGELPGLSMSLDNGLQLQLIGRIDRVDQSIETEQLYLRVIDYKSGPKKLALADVWNGLNLQLLVYLDVVLTNADAWLGRKAEIGGVFYYQVADPVVTAKRLLTADEAAKERAAKLKMKGLMLADTELARLMDGETESGNSELLPYGLKKDGSFTAASSVATAEQFRSLQGFVRNTVKELTTRMTDGEIRVAPYTQGTFTACQICPYKAVCHYDPLLEGNEVRQLGKWKDKDVWTMLAGNGEGGERHDTASSEA
ncbi:helicase-exonuclease AddAB subunit AddB [Brevibacillus migulae]|uniref:helicase-exonuclease AddAB subunit AddB n=1 Tax=Brevibacillus migulae TaxID=1644114 RepID=UPI00106E1AC0|nr:helicase-exonuclease AddAB subunit AddB [Brevibacillus migulae]